MIDPNLDARLLGALLDAIPDAVVISDAAGIITRANAAAGKLFGHDPAQMLGNPVTMLMPQAMAQRHDSFMRAHLETGQNRIIGRGRTVEGLRRNGDCFPLHLSVGRADHDGATHFVAILHDVSQRHATQEALARSARLDAIGQMTGGINHDFSNMLTVVIGNLELLEPELTNDNARAMLADALEAAEMGADLTDRLNAFGHKAPIQNQPTDVNKSCNAALSLLRRTFDPRYVMTAQLAQDLPLIETDSTQLQSALINLALNARDAMPDGGKLIIKSELANIDDTYIAQELDVAQGAYVRISVTDTGRGMGPETQQRVFEPFFTTKPVGKGTGLGLAMVYGFVRQSGGHITVYSEIGHGTTIGLYFPILDRQGSFGLPKQVQSAHPHGQNQTVLVVEDDPEVRKLSVARVNELGYKVHEASCGDTAAEILRTTPQIDAVFTDLVMPGDLDGLALARHIVATYPHIRILLTSGYAEDILRTQDDAMDHVILRKPYRQSDLAKALAAIFQTG